MIEIKQSEIEPRVFEVFPESQYERAHALLAIEEHAWVCMLWPHWDLISGGLTGDMFVWPAVW